MPSIVRKITKPFRSLFARIAINVQLAFKMKTVDAIVWDAVQSDNVTVFEILVKSDIDFEAADVIGKAIDNNSHEVFHFMAQKLGEEAFQKIVYKDRPLISNIARVGNAKMFQSILELGYSLNVPNTAGKTPLYLALEEGKLEVFRILVQEVRKQDEKMKREVNSLDLSFSDELPPLLELAIKHKRLDEVDILLKADASPDPITPDESHLTRLEKLRRSKIFRKSFLQLAIESEDPDILERLIRGGANINSPNICLIDLAMEIQNMTMVKMLVKNMDPDAFHSAKDGMGNPMLAKAVIRGEVPLIEYFLSIPKIDLRQRSFRGVSLLGEAAANRRIDIMRLLISKGADINETAPDTGATLLHAAVVAKNYEIVQFLIEQKINMNVADNMGETALDLSIKSADKKMFELLLNCDATDIDAGGTTSAIPVLHKGPPRRPPLQLAVIEKHMDFAILLIEMNCNVNSRDTEGATVVHHLARQLNSIKAVYGASAHEVPAVRAVGKALVDKKVDPNIRDYQGRTPLDVAGQGATDLETLLFGGVDFQQRASQQQLQRGVSRLASPSGNQDEDRFKSPLPRPRPELAPNNSASKGVTATSSNKPNTRKFE